VSFPFGVSCLGPPAAAEGSAVMPHQQRWYPASSGAYSKVEEPKPEAASQKSTISWSIWTLLIASLVINLVLTRSHLIMRQSSSHAHPLSLFTGDKSPDHDNVTPLNCNKRLAPAPAGAPACVSDPSELPRKGWSTAALQGKQGNVLQAGGALPKCCSADGH
jgi:hypothetical protein